MNIPMQDPQGNAEAFVKVERRKRPRLNEPILIDVLRSPARGERCRFSAAARNIGAGGLCATAPRLMEVGETITLFIRFALAGSHPPQAPAIAARAVVVRVEEERGGSCTFAVSFLRHRFI